MLPSFLLALREGLEAALIIGIVLGALRKFNRQQLYPVVWGGAGLAALVSIAAALVLNYLGAEFEGGAEEIFEGSAMVLAAGLLTWMIFWMQRQSRSVKKELEAGVWRATNQTGQKALFLLAFLSVAREGLELALFLIAARFASNAFQTLIGAAIGLATAGVLGWILFATTRRLSLQRFFQATNVLLILFAAGLVAHGVHEFNEASLIPAVVEHLWNANFILSEQSIPGQVLKALFGYNSSPSLTEVLAYLGYFALLTFGIRKVAHPVLTQSQAG